MLTLKLTDKFKRELSLVGPGDKTGLAVSVTELMHKNQCNKIGPFGEPVTKS